MKRTLIGLLVLIFVADSLLHPLLFSVEYVAIQRSLTDLESQLSIEKADQIGRSQAIIVLEDNTRMRGDVYGQNFFAEERDGKTLCYTIVDSTHLLDFQKITKKNSSDPFSSDNHNVFLKLQKDLFFQELVDMTVKVSPADEYLHFLLYLNTKTDPFFTVQTPPPNSVSS
jgi:hypothetical protein